MKNLNFSASSPYECQKNYRILRKAFDKLSIPIVSIYLISSPFRISTLIFFQSKAQKRDTSFSLP